MKRFYNLGAWVQNGAIAASKTIMLIVTNGSLICLFDLILYVPVNNFFSYVGTGLPGLNQY